MRRKIIGTIICILLIGTVLPATGIVISDKTPLSSTNGHILYVGGTGEGNYSKIQDAIDNASDGNTVFVFDDSSPYYEHFVVNKSIFLVGENRETTVIDGYENGNPIYVSSDGVIISGFTIMNGTADYLRVGGVDIFANYTTITNNIIKNNNIGIAIWNDGEYGNYWDDYEERYPDAKKIWLKGIWDTTYKIPGWNNKDNYPLINQWQHSKPRTITRNTASDNSYLFKFLEQFPILHRLLSLLRV